MPPRKDGNNLEADLLSELEGQTLDELRKARRHERLDVQLNVTLRHGNSTDVQQFVLHGTTADVSASGCRAIFPLPVLVGNVYRLHFEGDGIDLPLVFARCLRCRLLREDAFETGFSFFTPITLPGSGGSEDLLG